MFDCLQTWINKYYLSGMQILQKIHSRRDAIQFFYENNDIDSIKDILLDCGLDSIQINELLKHSNSLKTGNLYYTIELI